MPSRKRTNLIETGRVNFRENPDVVAFYKKKAQAHGLTLSDYIRQLAQQGEISGSVQNAVESIHAATANLEKIAKSLTVPTQAATSRSAAGDAALPLPRDILLSILACEELLGEVIGQSDTGAMARAKDRANRTLIAMEAKYK